MIDALLFSIPPELDGERVDRAVSQLVEGLSRSAVQRLIEEGNLSGGMCSVCLQLSRY